MLTQLQDSSADRMKQQSRLSGQRKLYDLPKLASPLRLPHFNCFSTQGRKNKKRIHLRSLQMKQSSVEFSAIFHFTPDHGEWSWLDCIIRCTSLWKKLSREEKFLMKAVDCVHVHWWAVEISSPFQWLQNEGHQGSRPQTWTPLLLRWKWRSIKGNESDWISSGKVLYVLALGHSNGLHYKVKAS